MFFFGIFGLILEAELSLIAQFIVGLLCSYSKIGLLA
jgi:hypothetical protein